MKTATFTTLWGLLIALAAITAESDHDGLDGTFLETSSLSDNGRHLLAENTARSSIDICKNPGTSVSKSVWKTANMQCDTGFEAVEFGTNSGLIDEVANGHVKITLLRWKCQCSTCKTSATCKDASNNWTKCSRNGDVDIVAYYEFRASLCHHEDVSTLSETRRTATTNKIKDLFGEHSVERTVDITNTGGTRAHRKTQQKETRRESRLGTSQGAGEKHACESDLDKCMDYSMDASECVILSFAQLSQIIRDTGHTSFKDYMNSRAQAYGLPSDCIDEVQPNWTWSPPTPGKFPDGRTGRKMLTFSVQSKPSKIREVGVKPADVSYVQFAQLRFKGYDHKLDRTGASIQVKLCKDGTVQGKTSTMDRFRTGDWLGTVKQTGVCGGKMTFALQDALFRDAVALTRFELVKLMAAEPLESPCRDRWGTGNAATNGHWDSTKCMNSIFKGHPKLQCHIVDIRMPSSVDWNELVSARFKSDGTEVKNGYSQGLVSDRAERRPDFGTDPSALDCRDGQPDEGKCSMKICHDNLSVYSGFKGDWSWSWKSPTTGATLTLNSQVRDAAFADGSCPICQHPMNHMWGRWQWAVLKPTADMARL